MSQAGPIAATTGSTSIDFVTDSGSAMPVGDELDILGGTLIDTSGAANVVTISAADAVVGSVATDSGTATPTSNAFTIAGAGTVSTSASGSTVTITGSGGGGLSAPVTATYRTVSTTDDLESTDYFVAVDTTGGAFTLTLLQTGMSSNQLFVVKDIGGGCGTDNLTIDTSGAATIDGSATYTLNANYGAINLLYDGTDFWVY